MTADGDAPQTVSELVWYTRLMVWVGCGVLLIEAAFGRSTGPLTLLAVLLMIAGFLGFLGGLVMESGSLGWLSTLAETSETAEETPAQSVSAPAVQVASDEEVIHPVVVEPEEETEEAPALVAAPVSAPVRRSVETQEVGAGSPLVGVTCPHCARQLEQDDIAAVCWNCGAPHHAACWVGNRFHCSTSGCEGAGSLEALATPERGPSKP